MAVLSDDGRSVVDDDADDAFTERGPVTRGASRARPALADLDCFVVVTTGYRLYRAGDVIPSDVAALPRLPAEHRDGAWHPVRAREAKT